MSQSLTEGLFFQERSYNSRQLLSVWSLNCLAQVWWTLRSRTRSILVFWSMLHTELRANNSVYMASITGKEHPCCVIFLTSYVQCLLIYCRAVPSQLGTIDAANLLRFPRYSETRCVCTRHPFQSLLPTKGIRIWVMFPRLSFMIISAADVVSPVILR